MGFVSPFGRLETRMFCAKQAPAATSRPSRRARKVVRSRLAIAMAAQSEESSEYSGSTAATVRRHAFQLLRDAQLAEGIAAAEELALVAPSGPAEFLENGFVQHSNEKRRVVCMMPGQTLRAHFHDSDELFHILRGRVFVSKEGVTETLASSDDIVIEAGAVHTLSADPSTGAQFFTYTPNTTRKTTFV